MQRQPAALAVKELFARGQRSDSAVFAAQKHALGPRDLRGLQAARRSSRRRGQLPDTTRRKRRTRRTRRTSSKIRTPMMRCLRCASFSPILPWRRSLMTQRFAGISADLRAPPTTRTPASRLWRRAPIRGADEGRGPRALAPRQQQRWPRRQRQTRSRGRKAQPS